ncbi:MAG: ATP-dependent helicase [Fusobacteriaceae bacterium]
MISKKELNYYVRKLEVSEIKESILKNGSDFYLESTKEQKVAIYSIYGDYLVVAGAGSGKTKTLIFRIQEMERRGINLEHILILTFSKKAALELKERVCTSGIDTVGVNVSTFHSFCFNLLKNNSIYFKILSKDEKQMVENYFKREAEKDKRIIEIDEDLKRFYIENNYLDFDGIIKKVLKELNDNKEFLRLVSEKYKFIMVDEYQDTDSFQKDFLTILNRAGSNIMAVGDDFQSIYGFRGATFKNILLFKKDFPGSQLIKFQNNFRSSENIVKFISSITDRVSNKIEKKSFAIKTNGEKPKVIRIKTLEDEGEYIAISIRKLLAEENFNGTIGILYRNKHLVNHIEKGLKKYNIEYNRVKEENAEYRIIEDFLDFYNFFMRPEGLIIEKVRAKLEENKRDKLVSTWELINLFNKVKFIKKESFKESEKNKKEYNKVIDEIDSELYKKIMSGYIEFILEINEERRNNLLLRLYVSINTKRINLEDIEKVLLCDCKSVSIDELKMKKIIIQKQEKKKMSIDLLTVHSAKGLEWDYLFVATAIDGVYPSRRFNDEKEIKDNEEYLDEERRVFYVACSRARKSLTITFPKKIHWFNKDFEGISRFLTEIEEINYDFYNKEI